MDLPLLDDYAVRERWLRSISGRLQEALACDAVRRFVEWSDGRTIPRPNLSLPESSDGHGDVLNESTKLRLAGSRPLHAAPAGDRVELHFGGRRWNFSESIKPALDLLADGTVHRVGELAQTVTSPDARLAVHFCLQTLLVGGVLLRVGE
jgi:hypothetical protein